MQPVAVVPGRRNCDDGERDQCDPRKENAAGIIVIGDNRGSRRPKLLPPRHVEHPEDPDGEQEFANVGQSEAEVLPAEDPEVEREKVENVHPRLESARGTKKSEHKRIELEARAYTYSSSSQSHLSGQGKSMRLKFRKKLMGDEDLAKDLHILRLKLKI